VPDITESEIKHLIHEISSGFTGEREKIGDYVKQEKMVSAYTLFYLPTNVPKLKFLLDHIPLDLHDKLKQTQMVEWGTGPGTFLLAGLKYLGASDFPLVGVDSSPLMLRQAKKCLEHLAPEQKGFELYSPNQINLINSPHRKTLIFGHSANEMRPDQILKIIDKLDPQFIIFIEPGTKEAFSIILKSRHEIFARGWNQIYPCGSSGICPMTDSDDWCHQYLITTHHHSLEQLSQKLKIDRRNQPLIAHLYAKNVLNGSKKCRIVRTLPASKFAVAVTVCHSNNQEGEGMPHESLVLDHLEIPFKNKDERKQLEKIVPGDDIAYSIIKALPDGRLRVKVIGKEEEKHE